MTSPIRLEGTNYLSRTMERADAELDWGGWLANPTTARLLNTTPRTLSVAERQAYVEKFDGRTNHLLGIWAKASDAFVGFWQIKVDESHQEFLLNVLIGVGDARAKGAQKETCDLIYQHFFDRLGMKAVRCTVSDRNEQMIDYLIRRRWTHVGVAEKPSAADPRPVAIHLFRLTREAWHARAEPGWTEDDASRLVGRKVS